MRYSSAYFVGLHLSLHVDSQSRSQKGARSYRRGIHYCHRATHSSKENSHVHVPRKKLVSVRTARRDSPGGNHRSGHCAYQWGLPGQCSHRGHDEPRAGKCGNVDHGAKSGRCSARHGALRHDLGVFRDNFQDARERHGAQLPSCGGPQGTGGKSFHSRPGQRRIQRRAGRHARHHPRALHRSNLLVADT